VKKGAKVSEKEAYHRFIDCGIDRCVIAIHIEYVAEFTDRIAPVTR
jgi:hypothetical protein